MNRYYCVKCNTESVIGSQQPEIQSCSCSKCKEPTTHRWLSLKGKPTPKAGEQLPQTIIAPSIPLTPPKQPTVQLDVQGGAVQVATPAPANGTSAPQPVTSSAKNPLAGLEQAK